VYRGLRAHNYWFAVKLGCRQHMSVKITLDLPDDWVRRIKIEAAIAAGRE
jgi:hypothetical protein